MSMKALKWAFSTTATGGTDKLVLVVLADHARNDHTAWPSLGRVAQHAGVSKRRTIDALQTLEDAGLVEVERRPGRISVYRLPVDEPVQTGSPVTGADGFTGQRQNRLRRVHHTGADGFTTPVQMGSPVIGTQKEPSKNPGAFGENEAVNSRKVLERAEAERQRRLADEPAYDPTVGLAGVTAAKAALDRLNGERP